MSIFSAIGKLFKFLLNLLKKICKNVWVILAIVAIVLLVYFCIPCAAFLLQMWGYLLSGLSAAWGYVVAAGSALWTWFSGLSFGEVLKLGMGAALLIDPKGTISGIGNAVGGVIGDVADAIVNSPVGTALAVGLGAWLLLGVFGKKKKKDGGSAKSVSRGYPESAIASTTGYRSG